MLPLRFVPYSDAAEVPNVVVDGSANAGTVLTLSHWPGMPTPPDLRDDLSAQIAFRALDQPHRLDGIEAVTNNHFDQDGLVSVFALVQPDLAMQRRDVLIDIARAGDFGTFEHRDAARVAMVIAALDDDERSPLDRASLSLPYPQRCATLYEWALPRLTDMADHPERWRELWDDEDAHLAESLVAIESGIATIEERREIDLAIVRVPDEWAQRATHRFTQTWTEALHPMAVNNSTECLRVLLIHGPRYRLELRYESWVMLVSRQVLPRPDLRTLAARLDTLEPGGPRWHADAPGSLTPKLELVGDVESGLPVGAFIAEVERFLATAPAAWDPFAPR
ncbi:MAG: DUF6687 family protein [Ilumatobacteraceae bacterium]